MSISSSTWQRLLAAFLDRFAGSGEGAGGDSGGEGSARATQAVGARAGSVLELLGLAGERCEAAVALQHWRPGCLDEGNGGVSGLRRWWLENDKSGLFFGALPSC